MEEVDGFLGADDLPENAALSEQLVKSVDTDLIVRQGEWGGCLLYTSDAADE